jgi:outer membrane receptor for ferrienterochelin and colicins
MNKDVAVGKWWGAEGHYTARIAGRHTVISGIEYRDNFVQQQKNYDENPYAGYLDDNRSSYNVGAYAQSEFILTDTRLVNAGGRYDHYKDFQGNLSPRIALIYAPLEKTTITLSYMGKHTASRTHTNFITPTVIFPKRPTRALIRRRSGHIRSF